MNGITVTEVSVFKEYKDGIWFPQEATQKRYQLRNGSKTLTKETNFSTINFTVNSALPEEFFNLNVPANTPVNDQTVGIIYRTP